VVTLLAILLLVVADAALAAVVGLIGRAKGRRFWFWALLGFVIPIVSLVGVLVLPRRRRR
jgi:hypothetical protein